MHVTVLTLRRGHVAEHPDGTGTVGGIPIDDSTTYTLDKTWGVFQVRSGSTRIPWQPLSVLKTQHTELTRARACFTWGSWRSSHLGD